MTRPPYVAPEAVPMPPGHDWLPGQIRYYPMQVLCGACSGLGCEHCEPAPAPSRWARLRARLRRRA